jgi:hypothetical protein
VIVSCPEAPSAAAVSASVSATAALDNTAAVFLPAIVQETEAGFATVPSDTL